MRVLLHMCCAPCALMPYGWLRDQGHELMGLFFNPNIQPFTEHQLRLDSAKQWASDQGMGLIVLDHQYDVTAWLRQMVYRESRSIRCGLCYHQRLLRSAQVAKKGGFDAFSTSLLYSVQQQHDKVKQAGQAAGAQCGVEFLYQDFRPHWRKGIEMSKELGLYRQQYCGCIYSESDRYLGKGSGKGVSK